MWMPEMEKGTDYAGGGRVGFKKGGIANRNMIAKLFE